jgi:hypothetical protein
MTSMGLTQLPVELVREVFRSIPKFRDRLSFLRTCRSYYALLINDLYKFYLAQRTTDRMSEDFYSVLSLDRKHTLSRFLDAGLSANHRFRAENRTLLERACCSRVADNVKLLIAKGADVRAYSGSGTSCLHSLLGVAGRCWNV